MTTLLRFLVTRRGPTDSEVGLEDARKGEKVDKAWALHAWMSWVGLLHGKIAENHVVKTITLITINKLHIWEWFIAPIYGDLGDGLLLF